jgi:predicted nucleic acid-binding Zn ribbon protein
MVKAENISPEGIISPPATYTYKCPLCLNTYEFQRDMDTSLGSLPNCPVCAAVLPPLVSAMNLILHKEWK